MIKEQDIVKNFTNVVPDALAEAHHDDQYTHLVLAAPSVDITNIDVSNLKVDSNIEVYKQKVHISCQNMLTVATNALETHQTIEKVILMEHPPRHDTCIDDPTGLKPELAKFANVTLQHLVNTSSMKDKIIVGRHNLDFSNNMTNAIFKDNYSGRYDGIHMYGQVASTMYCRSVLRMFTSVFPNKSTNNTSDSTNRSCEQTLYQQRTNVRSYRPHIEFSLPLRNRFEILGN